MAKLSELININPIQQDCFVIQGVEIPVCFTMETMEFVQEGYGKSYTQFERDYNKMMKGKLVKMDKNVMKIMRCLIYAMVRSGGTETTFEELTRAISLNELGAIFQKCTEIFSRETFQQNDMKKFVESKK